MPAPWDDPRIARGVAAQLAERRARIAAGDGPLGWVTQRAGLNFHNPGAGFAE
jgi:hypothetical protein